MTLDYLAVHDALLAQGAVSFGDEFRRRQAECVISFRCEDGGFRGRMGASDPYYTDFACRALRLLGAGTGELRDAADYVIGLEMPPRDLIDAFCRLNVLRLNGMLGDEALSGFRKGAARTAPPDGGALNAYETFLACLCRGILREEVEVDVDRLPPAFPDAREDALVLGGHRYQTSTTAASAAVRLMAGAMPESAAQGICAFLVAMQAEDGGFLAHPAAPHGDMLSTYTALITLAMLGGEREVDLPALARFLRGTALQDGGFRSCAFDPETDVEYTFYGVATMALLSACLD